MTSVRSKAQAAQGPTAYVACVQAALAPLADAGKAGEMCAYMRGQFDFLGVQTPARRAALAALGRASFDAAAALRAAEQLWRLPAREYRYAAVDLLARHAKVLRPEHVPRLLRLAQREAWWDTVDGLAGVVGDVLRLGRDTQQDVQQLMDKALRHPSLWVRRIAMLHQLGWRLQTDTARLYAYAERLAPEQDFFIRKAIGWALRDYARWDPQGVERFVTRHADDLSPLSVREALRGLKKR
jgi:3-methyladenine DNA glycosylase AlkD